MEGKRQDAVERTAVSDHRKGEMQVDKYKASVKHYSVCFLLAPLFMVLESCGEFILPYLNAQIINNGAANGDIPYILRRGLMMAILAGIMLITGVLGANFAVRGSAHLASDLRADVFRQIQKFSFSEIDRFSTGSLITRITNDITQIQNFTQTLLRGMFRSPVMILGALAMSFAMQRQLAFIILAVVFALAAVIAAIIVKASPRYSAMQRQLDQLNGQIGETITAERVVKAYVREDYERTRFAEVNEKLVERSTAALKLMLLVQPASAIAINVTTLLVVYISGRQIMIGQMALGTLTAFITYLSQVLTGLNFLANIVLQGTRAAASDRRISEVLRAVPAIDDANAEPGRTVRTGAIEFRDVSFRYFKNNREKVLCDVSLRIEPGEMVGIIGSTGSGKSTLVSMIPRLYDADEGSVLVDGADVRTIPLAALRESVAMVLQKNTLFSGTVEENLRWGNPNATHEQVVHAAKLAQADGFISAMPDGYDAVVERGGVNFSGGQKQRLCIARALLREPKILILDDSTSAVDTATDAAIRRALREALPGVTKLIIAQRITSVWDADRIIVLDGGRVVGIGRHDTLLHTCETYAEICDSQRDREEAEAHG